MTNFYYAGCGQRFKLISEESDRPSLEKENTDEEEIKTSENELSGFVGAKTGDIPYCSMLDHFGIVCEEFKAQHQEESDVNQEIEWAVVKNRSPMFQARREFLPVEIKADIIVNCLYKGNKSEQEAETRGLDKQQVKNIIYEFKTIRRVSKKVRKVINLRRRKLNKRHLKLLRKFTEENLEHGFTLEHARTYLLDKSSELKDVSISTLDQILNKQLGLSFKKLGNNHPTKANPENRNNLKTWILAISELVKMEFYVVYLDEFLINRNTKKEYGWALKGQPGRMLSKPTEFRMSFIVAHSSIRVEGIVGTKTTFNQEKYFIFLKSLIHKLKSDPEVRNKKIIVIADNCIFHRTKIIERIFKQEQIICLFIPPYWPEANACEKLINYVKVHIKGHIRLQRYCIKL